MRRQQENLALANGNVVKIAVVDNLEQHVAFKLIEEFLHRIVMIVGSLGRPADSRSSFEFLASTTKSASRMVALKASRSIFSRSGGRSGGATKGRPIPWPA